jgi:apolipoprotein D and lipocalin family protein
MHRSLPLLAPLILAVSLACASAPPPAPVAGPVDLERYAGRWLELARLPAFFQRRCVLSRADYAPIPGGLSVLNRCATADGAVRRAEGSATPVAGSGNARLAVRFRGFWARLAPVPDEGNYWILALDPDYRSVVVGTADRRYLWILARKPLAEAEYAALVEKARAAGYDVARLLRADWTKPWPEEAP